MGGGSEDWKEKKASNDILGVSAQAPEPAGNELLIVVFVILAVAPRRLLVISNYKSFIRDRPPDTGHVSLSREECERGRRVHSYCHPVHRFVCTNNTYQFRTATRLQIERCRSNRAVPRVGERRQVDYLPVRSD